METNPLHFKKLKDPDIKWQVNAMKMVAILALHDQGWGETRIRRFSNQFNDILERVSQDKQTPSEICDVIYDETGLSMGELTVKS